MREEIFGPVGLVVKFEDDEGLFVRVLQLLIDLFLMTMLLRRYYQDS
jgi:hypothetical protein